MPTILDTDIASCHHLVFLVAAVALFILNDSRLSINQPVATESIAAPCQSIAWIVGVSISKCNSAVAGLILTVFIKKPSAEKYGTFKPVALLATAELSAGKKNAHKINLASSDAACLHIIRTSGAFLFLLLTLYPQDLKLPSNQKKTLTFCFPANESYDRSTSLLLQLLLQPHAHKHAGMTPLGEKEKSTFGLRQTTVNALVSGKKCIIFRCKCTMKT